MGSFIKERNSDCPEDIKVHSLNLFKETMPEDEAWQHNVVY
ncbi:hypothetical protein JCM19235_7036 [Vibrio maritimus]|uniref:Uncharacterized protein n=1 Tax=Vibrio maritimus TaxID=990268 RepID=A0A090S6Q5_9VIBR|nr:hypothetical protein JCM19235_7036 [Vibrio maritimus]